MQLATAGLVTLQSRRGAFVASLSLKEIIERFEVMATLEGACGALAARRIGDEERQELLEAHEACAREASGGDADAYYYVNERFHHLIYAACHNAFLIEQARQLHDRLKPYRRLQLRARSRVATSLAEHQEIMDAIFMGDGAKAERLLKDHVLIQGSAWPTSSPASTRRRLSCSAKQPRRDVREWPGRAEGRGRGGALVQDGRRPGQRHGQAKSNGMAASTFPFMSKNGQVWFVIIGLGRPMLRPAAV